MSELMQLLTMAPHPIGAARAVSFVTAEDSENAGFCSRCFAELPPSGFYLIAGKLSTVCKKCAMQKSAQYYQRRQQKCA